MAWTALKCSRINLWHSCQRKGVLIFFTVACHDYKVYWNLPRRNFITHKIYTYYSHGVYDFFTHIYIYIIKIKKNTLTEENFIENIFE